MSRFTKAITSPRVNVCLFIAAALLLIVASVSGTRAALTYYSDTYVARFDVSNIGVSLLENGQVVSQRNYDGGDRWAESTGELLENLVAEGQSFVVGRAYPEELAVRNSGTIGQYVRVIVYKYWEQPDGQGGYEKVRSVSPNLIDLRSPDGSDWIIDEAASTDERTVYYYRHPLAQGETSSPLSSTISVSSEVLSKVTQTEETRIVDGKEYTTLVTTYDYDGLRFCLEAEVDAVQDHNAESAATSAWGKSIVIRNGELGLA